MNLVDPFGNDMSDLPLKTYCKVTEIQIKSIMRRERIPYDLGVGPIDEDGCQGEGVVKSASSITQEILSDDTPTS